HISSLFYSSVSLSYLHPFPTRRSSDLSCKACASDCPTGIDMATFKSETLHRTYQGKRRPRSHYTLGRLPQWLRLAAPFARVVNRSEEHTSELQSRFDLVCRLLLEKKNK